MESMAPADQALNGGAGATREPSHAGSTGVGARREQRQRQGSGYFARCFFSPPAPYLPAFNRWIVFASSASGRSRCAASNCAIASRTLPGSSASATPRL